ncbi:MAG: molybdopterin-dependent oxidoreductase [Bdellovibrionales bacterium]|nr:molybdopterin-dependent oxidoreductase [Bdellovibrionales bacterium]
MSIGTNIRHDSSVTHVAGESVFIDDRPEVRGEVHVGVVGSPIARGILKSIDAREALAHPDCLGVFTAADFHAKHWGTITHDQPFLVVDAISYMQEAVCIVASSKRGSVEAIKKLVKIEATPSEGVFSIDEAKAKGEILYRAASPFIQGDVDAALKSSPHRLKGIFRCGGQEHFYLESQAAIAYPLENGQIEVHSSSQHPSETQRVVAEALGLSFHQVVCVVKRMGGGFGGKESQGAPIAAYAALVADRLRRPARIVLTKDQDMMITGKRHPFQNEYEVGFDNQGRLLAVNALLQSDGGAYLDLSSSILERAMFHLDGAYHLPNVRVEGICYRTHHHPHTAFRGFGGPQGNMTIESILEDVAHYLKKDASEVRRINLYSGANLKTPYGQVLENNLLPRIHERLLLSSGYEKRLGEIREFNSRRCGKVRGISLTATKFGISFTARFLNQANALVNLQLDGTLQVSTGATEMGQGVNTKIQQIVAHAFGVCPDAVRVMPTSTEKNHNTSPTAASSGSDLNGAAALLACDRIKARLIPLARARFQGQEFDPTREFESPESLTPSPDPDMVFSEGVVRDQRSGKSVPLRELIHLAYQNRISLGSYAHYKTPDLGFDKTRVVGRAFNYFTQGMAVSEVEVDEYTGEMKVRRADILMDLGRSLNPGIDRGQTTGAFIQGMGWVTSEHLVYDRDRNLLTHSPTTYKIPNVQDTPREFNVEFIENPDNDRNVHGSKAVGEPPFLLGTSVWTAIKHALSFRANGQEIRLVSPATSEVILMELTRLKGE